jgi:hypothetical protein
MSPQSFKSFIRAAGEVIKAYESSFGALTISEEDTKPTRSSMEIEALIKGAREARKTTTPPSSSEKKPPSKRSRGDARH